MDRAVKYKTDTLRGRVYAVTSGKGGVGKTSISVNLSISLARAGLRILLIDADMGLANVDLMTGVSAAHSIEDVLNGDASIFDALAEGPEGLTILPASSAVGRVQEAGSLDLLKKELVKLENAFDYIFIDTGAGISANVVDFVFMAEEVIVVMTPEPTAFADAYAMVKLVKIERPELSVSVIVNMASKEDEAAKIFAKFNEIVKRFLNTEVVYRGCIFRDKAVPESIMRQIPLALFAPKSAAMLGMMKIARSILGLTTAHKKSLFSR